ncbi:MAG TPA: ATP-binding protein [Polyangiaceae bacterium]|nr:ATP-binding protein [Polyangiaceae bacterium]
MTASGSAAAERVLVLMPTTRDAERTLALLEEATIIGSACADLAELCRELRAGAGAALLTDEAISADAVGQLSEAMREQPAWSALPVVVLAREGWSKLGQRMASDMHGSLVIVERPVRTRTLVEIVSSALRTRQHQYRIRDELIVRERQAAELLAQDERLQFALSAGGLGSWELDLETLQMECSSLCKVNFGRPVDAPFSYAQLREAVHPLDRERVSAAIERSIAEGCEYDIEYRVMWANGDVHWVLVRGRATYDAGGRPRRMAGVSLDVTERKRMYEALQQSQSELARQAEQLRRADRRKDEFLATLAHELRNPLAPIRTGVEFLAHAPEGEDARRTLGMMQRQIGHMVRLIDDLLDVSRITSGKLQLKRQRVELATIIDTAVESSRPLIERKNHTLRVSVPEDVLVLDADLTRIAQVLGNLLNNSSNYTSSGGEIELTARRDGHSVVIEVRDNGCGIPGDRLDDVFEMFSQVNRALERSQGGLGIGLALVRSLVQMHGGTVSAASPGLGQGSTFSIRLPLAVGSERSASVVRDASAQKRTAPKRILVVDDNEDAAEMLAIVLGQSGYQTRTAYQGRSALASVHEWPPDIVILDIGLPDMNGYDVARELRRNGHASSLVLIALTGWGTQDDKQKAMDAGFDVHLTKPVDAGDLQRALGDVERKGRGRAVPSLSAAGAPAKS